MTASALGFTRLEWAGILTTGVTAGVLIGLMGERGSLTAGLVAGVVSVVAAMAGLWIQK